MVERFLELLRLGDVDGAMALLAVDVEYDNVGLPTVRGRERVRAEDALRFTRGYETDASRLVRKADTLLRRKLADRYQRAEEPLAVWGSFVLRRRVIHKHVERLRRFSIRSAEAMRFGCREKDVDVGFDGRLRFATFAC